MTSSLFVTPLSSHIYQKNLHMLILNFCFACSVCLLGCWFIHHVAFVIFSSVGLAHMCGDLVSVISMVESLCWISWITSSVSVSHSWEDCWSKLSSGLSSGTRKKERPLGELSLGSSGLLPDFLLHGTGPYLSKVFSLAVPPTWKLTLCHCCLAQEQMEEHQ